MTVVRYNSYYILAQLLVMYSTENIRRHVAQLFDSFKSCIEDDKVHELHQNFDGKHIVVYRCLQIT